MDNKNLGNDNWQNNNQNNVNAKNAQEFENLMKDSSTDTDKYYYDSKNPFVKLLLFVLAAIIIVGCYIIFSS